MKRKHRDSQNSPPDTTQQLTGMDNFVPPLKPKSALAMLAKLLLVLIIIVVIAGGALWLVKHHKSNKPAAKSQTTTSQSTPLSIESTTKYYSSTNYNLAFNYPNDWTLNDDASNGLTATSPVVSLKDENGQEFNGQIVMTIQNQQTTIAALAPGNAVAALESQRITYKQPTPDQRAQTYVTYVNNAGSTGSINELYITGDDGYQADQSVPMSDLTQDDPLVSITFLKCSDAACQAAAKPATAISTDSWSNANLSKPLLQMLESLVID